MLIKKKNQEDLQYRQYKDQYTQLGKRADQVTMGRTAAWTGGYGSGYARNVGYQTDSIQQLGDVRYKPAYNRYQDEGGGYTMPLKA